MVGESGACGTGSEGRVGREPVSAASVSVLRERFAAEPLEGDVQHSKIRGLAPLAQLVEQLTLNQRVLGSSPRGGTEKQGKSERVEKRASLGVTLGLPVKATYLMN